MIILIKIIIDLNNNYNYNHNDYDNHNHNDNGQLTNTLFLLANTLTQRSFYLVLKPTLISRSTEQLLLLNAWWVETALSE